MNKIQQFKNNFLYDRKELTIQIISLLGLKSPHRLNYDEENWMCRCPYHKDKTPSFGINLDKGIYHCFSCGRSGTVERLYKDLTGSSIYDVLGIKNDSFSKFSIKNNYYTWEDELEKEEISKKKIFVNYNPQDFIDFQESKECLEYIDKRGIPYDECIKAGFKYTKETKINTTLFKERLCIPIMEEGVLTSIEGRRINKDTQSPKVLYPKNTSVNLLYDIDNLNFHEDVFACEGLMDLFVLRSCNEFENSTSIFGANITKRQLEQISKLKRFIYIPDNDKAGDETINQLRNSNLDNIYILKLPSDINGIPVKDIGDIPSTHSTVQDLYDRKWLKYMKRL